MLRHYKFSQTSYVIVFGIVLRVQVVLGTVNEAHNVGILLYGAALSEVAELRTLAVLGVASAFHTSVKLRQRDNRYVKLLCKLFQRPGNHTHLLLAAAELHA